MSSRGRILRLTHPALYGGHLVLRRSERELCWRPTYVYWPDGKRFDWLRCLESVDLEIDAWSAERPQLVDRSWLL